MSVQTTDQMVHLVRNVVQLIRNCFTEEMQYTLQIGCGTGKSLFRNEVVNSSRIVAHLRQLPGQSAGGFYRTVVYCRPGDTVEIRCGIIFNRFRIVTLGSQNTVVQGWDIAISYPDKASCLIVVQLSWPGGSYRSREGPSAERRGESLRPAW